MTCALVVSSKQLIRHNRGLIVSVSNIDKAVTQVAASAAITEARRRILVTAVALERYNGLHGAYPSSLAALVPEFLKTVPADFMDGQPPRHRLTSDGHFVLYSVGLDCVDDGGVLPSPDHAPFNVSANGSLAVATNQDIVWPRPAPASTPKP